MANSDMTSRGKTFGFILMNSQSLVLNNCNNVSFSTMKVGEINEVSKGNDNVVIQQNY